LTGKKSKVNLEEGDNYLSRPTVNDDDAQVIDQYVVEQTQESEQDVENHFVSRFWCDLFFSDVSSSSTEIFVFEMFDKQRTGKKDKREVTGSTLQSIT